PGPGYRFEAGGVLRHLGPELPIDAVQSEFRNHWRKSAVDERSVVDDDDQRLLQQPLAILPVGGKGLAVPEVARRRPLFELAPERLCVLLRGARGTKYLERALAVGRVLFTGEGLVLRRSDVAEVACQVHYLVIAEQQVDAPAGFERLLLETHQQVHHLARIRSPI